MKLYVHFAGKTALDIIILSADGLIMANTFACADDEDALYYIMAAVKDSGFDPLDDEVILSGDSGRISNLTDTLRHYLNSVMPLLLLTPATDLPIELLPFNKPHNQ